MTTVTLEKVAADVRNFETANGKFAAFKVMLDDGRVGEVVAKADNVGKRQEQFRGFIGKPTDLTIEDAGTFPDGGPKPLRIKLPQQQQGSGGKGRDYVPRYVDSEEGAKWLNERLDRSRALELAQAEGVGVTTDLATKFYEWLRATSAAPVPIATGSESGSSGVALPDPDAAREGVDPYREGGTTPSELSDTGPAVAPGDAEEVGDSSRGAPAASSASEPHEHVPGPQKLASGKVLCIWEDSNGKVCGQPVRLVAPTIHTAPVADDEQRKDIA